MSRRFRLPALAAGLLLATGAGAAEDLRLCKEGWAASQGGDQPRALALYAQCLETGALGKESQARTWRNIGIAHRRAGHSGQALAAYDKALALDPPDPWFDRINRGNALSDLGQFEAALKEYDAAEALQPREGEVDYNRGIVLERMEKPDAAVAAFRRAYEKGLRTRLLYDRLLAYKLIAPAR